MEQTEIRKFDGEQTEVAAQAAAAENGNGAAAIEVSLGKFKDVGSLLKAYESLESEFTRRSKRLKELEGKYSEKEKEITLRGASLENDGDSGKQIKGDGVYEHVDKKSLRIEDGGDDSQTETKADLSEEKHLSEDKKSVLGDEGKDGTDGDYNRVDSESNSASKDYDEVNEIVKQYLLNILNNRPPVSPIKGSAVTVPPKRPRTFEEAGKLVKRDLEK